MKTRVCIMFFIAFSSVAGCKQRAGAGSEIKNTTNHQDAPARLMAIDFTNSVWLRLAPEFGPEELTLPGAVKKLVLSAGNSTSYLSCEIPLDATKLYQRDLSRLGWMNVFDRPREESVPAPDDPFIDPRSRTITGVFLPIKASVDSGFEDFQGMKCRGPKQDELGSIMASELRCLFEIKVNLPAGATNPDLVCDLAGDEPVQRRISFEP